MYTLLEIVIIHLRGMRSSIWGGTIMFYFKNTRDNCISDSIE